MHKSLGLAAAISLGGVGLAAPAAMAAPMRFDHAFAIVAEPAKYVENIRWICDPYGGGCHWLPRDYWRRWALDPYGSWRPWVWGPAAPGFGYWGRWAWGPYGSYHPWPRRYGWGGYERPYW